MGRVRGKKSFEDVYGPNIEMSVHKAAQHGALNTKQTRGNTTAVAITAPLNASKQGNGMGPGKALVSMNTMPILNETGRHKTQRQTQEVKPVTLPNHGKDEKLSNLSQKTKRDNPKKKTSRNGITIYDNRDFYPEGMMNDLARPSQQNIYNNNQHGHHHHPNNQKAHDDDEDAEEFFEMIKQTVENAVGKTISDLLSRNFVEVNAKLDRFTSELKTTQNMLAKLQADVNKQIVHYGEEGARHFRYLCMKSEYDKMFYQHQNIVSSTQPPSSTAITQSQMQLPSQMPMHIPANMPNVVPQMSFPSMQTYLQTPKLPPNVPKLDIGPDGDTQQIPCTCRNVPFNNPKEQSLGNNASSSSTRLPSNNSSSAAGLREVLGQIQRFCNQLEGNELTKSVPVLKKQQRATRAFQSHEATIINKDVFADEDEEECLTSSDNSSPRSIDHMTKYESKAIRASARPPM